jgi:hypothetical protein
MGKTRRPGSPQPGLIKAACFFFRMIPAIMGQQITTEEGLLRENLAGHGGLARNNFQVRT